MTTTGAGAFAAVQVDVTFDVGVALGRYVVERGHAAPSIAAFLGLTVTDRGEDVLVVSTAGAPLLPDRRGLRRRPRRLARGLATEDVWLTRFTFVRGDHVFEDVARAEHAVAEVVEDDVACEALVDEALFVANRAVRAGRAARAAPGDLQLDRAVARSIRVGVGTPDGVASGVLELAAPVLSPSPEGPRRAAMEGEQVAAMLAGRTPLLATDRLLLRVAQDVADGADLVAALVLPAVIDLAAIELSSVLPAERIASLHARAQHLHEHATSRPWADDERQALAEVVREVWDAARQVRGAGRVAVEDTAGAPGSPTP